MHLYHHVVKRLFGLGLIRFLFTAVANLPVVAAIPVLTSSSLGTRDDGKSADDPSFWVNLGVATALVIAGGAFAGLTIALMGQDEIYLQVIKTSGEGSEKKNAATVLNLLNKGKHWVLVTLLLSNVITNETLPIVLDRSLGGGWQAVLGSTALIVVFGEVVPQSICVRYGLPIGAWMAPCVLALMYIMSPVAWPIAKLLDKLLGVDKGTFYKKAGLKTLVTLHEHLGAAGEQLNSDEVTIISAVLDLKEKPVGSIMIPMEDVFTMSADTVLDQPTMDIILSQGYSRIPIYSPDKPQNFVGMLLVKMLITYDPEDCKQVRDFALATLPETRAETSCLDIVNFFQEGKSHMVLVSEYPGEDHGALGVVTLEDVIEELIGEEIIDESDVFIDVHKAIRRMAPAPKSRVPKGHIVSLPPDEANMGRESTGEDSNPLNLPDQISSQAGDLLRSHRKQSSGKVDSPPPPIFKLRKSNTFEREGDSPIIQRGATPEIREQLRHLGPSNLASRPRTTRYNNVKIKPGTDSSAVSNSLSRDLESGLQSPELLPRASESTGLIGGLDPASGVKSAGKSATGGIRALKASYGGVEDSLSGRKTDDETRPTVNTAVDTEDDLLSFPQPKPARPGRGNSSHHTSGDNTAISSPTTPPFFPRGPTKSGSLTEQYVDSNGIRKVILEATNSHSPSDEDKHHERQRSWHPTSSSNTPQRTSPTYNEEDEDDDDDEGRAGEPDTHEVTKPDKKKKRRKKRKPGKAKPENAEEENRPLLG